MLVAPKEMAVAGYWEERQPDFLPSSHFLYCLWSLFPSHGLTWRDTINALKSWCRIVESYFSMKLGYHLVQCPFSLLFLLVPSRGLCSGEAHGQSPHTHALMSRKMKSSAPPMYLVPLTQCLLELYLHANKAWYLVGAGPQENNKQLQ